MGIVMRRVAGAAVAATALLAPSAAHAGTLDQQQTNGSAVFQNVSALASQSQSFTAGLSGNLDQVDLDIKGTSPTAPLMVEIRSTTAGAPTGTVLASTSVPASSVGASVSFVPATFSSPVVVVAGTQYAIVSWSTTAGANPYTFADDGGTNAYAGGINYYTPGAP